MRILITSWGSFGDVYPYLGLALALKARGHQPVLAVPEFYRPHVEGVGLDFVPVGVEVDPNDHQTIARLMDPLTGGEAIIKELLAPAVRTDYETLAAVAPRADVIVTHPMTFAATVLAQQRKMPWVSTVLAPMSFFSATDVPMLPVAPWLVHLRRLGSWYGRLVGREVRRKTRPWLEPVRALRADLGLPSGGHPLFEGQFSPSLNLALFSQALAEPQDDWPPNAIVTGFVFYNGPDLLSPALEQFLAEGPPPVVFTLGTSAVGAAGSFYEESVKAATALGVRAVLLTGGYAQNRPSAPIGKDILLVDRAPHQLLFPRASAIVHQGGAGTMGQALRSGKPMLVVPYGHDQPDNAFRLANLGVSRTVFPKRYQKQRVAGELRRLLTETIFAERASKVALTVRSEDGANAAAAEIERVAGALRPVASSEYERGTARERS